MLPEAVACQLRGSPVEARMRCGGWNVHAHANETIIKVAESILAGGAGVVDIYA